MYRPVLVTPPTTKLVTVAAAKAALDVDYDDKDALIEGLIAAATAHLDGWTGILGRALVAQTWRQDFDRFSRHLRLPMFPVLSVSSITSRNKDGQTSTVGSANYATKDDDLGSYVRFKDDYSFPSDLYQAGAVSVTYVAGYADVEGVSGVPQAIKQAALLMVRQWFDNPSAINVGNITTKLPFGVEALLGPYRRVPF